MNLTVAWQSQLNGLNYYHALQGTSPCKHCANDACPTIQLLLPPSYISSQPGKACQENSETQLRAIRALGKKQAKLPQAPPRLAGCRNLCIPKVNQLSDNLRPANCCTCTGAKVKHVLARRLKLPYHP
eukprot:4293323-Amphidinium_carterae.5